MTPAKVLASRSTVAAAGHSAISQPGPAHLIRALGRYLVRMGNQLAGAVTYFLVLAIIPVAMFTFAGLGFVLDVLRPDLVPVIAAELDRIAPGSPALSNALESVLGNWQAVGVVGVLAGLYSGQGFIETLKSAIRTQLAHEIGEIRQEPIVRNFLVNIAILFGLVTGILLTVALTVIGTGLASLIVDFLDLPAWAPVLLILGQLLISLAAAWGIFMFLFTVLPQSPVERSPKMRGSFIGAVSFVVLLNLATILIDLFSGNQAASIFGSLIAVMLTMNLFARLILFVAAWVGTAARDRPAEDTTPDDAITIPRLQAQTLGALLTAAGLIALTLLGFKRLDDREDDHP
ncbi:membrane protein [Brevibacterium sanguinis]|uniref:Membrane protein n=2 Tax=Brevibacterium TaxID=1696 RepID=A0A366IGS8_9MICO|nr:MULTISPECIES: YhjD/YihY/BrkB family envelope integrity protein [Brevibacterium]RBP63956.1 membrane protein [Brevibacterium sanguinis]RBP70769.1 membrane protein [Brevibacterium celere]